MKRVQRIASFFAVVLAAGCAQIEPRSAHFDRDWPAANIRRVEVYELNGTISVEAGTADVVKLAADVRSRGAGPQKGKENDGYFKTQVIGDTLIIGERRRRRVVIGIPFFSHDDVRIDYTLRVPAQVALELRTVNGRIATRGIAGETSATTVNGEVDLESTGSSEVAARAVNGRVAARFLNDFHGAKLGTVNGRVTAVLPASASFLGEFSQVNGDFEAAFPLAIHSRPGGRRVSGEVNGGRYSLKITTVNGDIKIDNGPGAPIAPSVMPELPGAPVTPPAAVPQPPKPPAPRT